VYFDASFFFFQSQDEQPGADIQGIMDKVYESINTSGSCSRLLIKLVPLQYTCFAGLVEIEDQLRPLIKQHFKDSEPSTYMVALKRRNNGDVIRIITHSIPTTVLVFSDSLSFFLSLSPHV
jgi:hypothetical protein